jgi:hypothetical protein
MCFFSAPKVPTPPQPPQPAQFQAMKLPDNGATNNLTDDMVKRRRAMAATAFTGALGLGNPSTTTTLGG